MYRLIDLFNSTAKERNHFFLLFEKLPEEVWHAKLQEDLWSPENIFRHLLSSLLWIQNYLPDVEIEDSPMGLEYGTEPKGKYSLREIQNEFERVNTVLKKAIEKFTEKDEDFEIKTEFGKNTRANLIAGFLTHEHSHFGQVTYIIKRYTGKSDQELREILINALNEHKKE